ncbi:MAG: DUF2142 domain-containing protein [Thomasclavelia sp.]
MIYESFKNFIYKRKIIILSFIIAVVFGTICYFSVTPKQVSYIDYLGLNAESVNRLTKSSSKKEYEENLKNIDNLQTIELKNGDSISQNFVLNTTHLNAISLNFNCNGKTVLKIKVIDESGKVVFVEERELKNGFNEEKLIVNSSKYDRKSNFSISMQVITDTNKLELYTVKVNSGALTMNGDAVDSENVLVKVESNGYVYKQKTIGVLLAIIIFLLVLLLLSVYYSRKKIYLFINNKVLILKNKFWYLVCEWISILALLYVFLQFFCLFIYSEYFSYIYMIIFIFLMSILIFLIIILTNKFKNDIAYVFLLIAIPIGLAYMIFILPDYVPDENVHFGKAYLTSLFDFTASGKFYITEKYSAFSISNYNDIIPHIFSLDDYSSLRVSHEVCSYNFILYIIPAIALMITRVLHLSIYFGFYLGRMFNLIVFLFFAYNSIKIAPKAKWLFFIYYFNPMMLQLGMSYSADCMVYSVCIFSIAYFLKLYYSDQLIQNKDIVIILCLIAIIAVTKFNYLPLFGVYFLILNKVLKIDLKQRILLLCGIGLVVLFYLLSLKLSSNAVTLPAHVDYLNAMSVDQSKQIELLLANPKYLITMLSNTIQKYGDFYAISFVGDLGWLNININLISYWLYIIMLLVTAVFSKVDCFNILKRLWMIFIGLCLGALVILGLYLQWTTVGNMFAEGVQGRYFIPCVIMILLAISGIFKNSIKINHCYWLFIFSICVIEGLVFIDIMSFFI